MNLGFERSFARTDEAFTTLALVIPDNRNTDEHPIVIRTNSGIFRKCYQSCLRKPGSAASSIFNAIYQEIAKQGSANVDRREDKSPCTPTISELPLEWGPISPGFKAEMLEELEKRIQVFATHEWDVGLTDPASHEITLTDETPFRQRARRISPADLKDLQDHSQQLLGNGIKESRSPYASPIVLVRKKIWMCVDYR